MKYIILLFFVSSALAVNKYSAAVNNAEVNMPSLRTLEKPFRMAKLNLLWTKAQVRLTETKLKSLFGELKIHDKEEITWKKLRTDGKDKDGLKEAELRKKLIGIMSTYDLLEHFEDVQDSSKHKPHKALNEASEDHINKSMFKDKKLNKLWVKAEQAGFNVDELRALKEEFGHHQDKIDQYFSVLRDVEHGPDDKHENSLDESLDRYNTLDTEEEKTVKKDYLHKTNMLRDKHRELRDGYDRLYRLALKGPNSKEFVEPKVQGLWRIAVQTNFTPDELESLRIELLHYENRLLKLRHMQAEAALNEESHKEKVKLAGEKTDGLLLMEENIKKQARKVDKLHTDIESRIMQRHVEL